MKSKKRKLHELPYTESTTSGTIRLVSGARFEIQAVDGPAAQPSLYHTLGRLQRGLGSVPDSRGDYMETIRCAAVPVLGTRQRIPKF